jgi:hypothetical protein
MDNTLFQFSEGSGTFCEIQQGYTLRTIPHGSKQTLFTVRQWGQRMFTAATVDEPDARPFPSHFTVISSPRSQQQQANSMHASNSVMIVNGPWCWNGSGAILRAMAPPFFKNG